MRLTCFCKPVLSGNFNPRTHVGCDPITIRYPNSVTEFQSTHPRGVRRYGRVRVREHRLISIHAPTWGATVINPCHTVVPEFQSTHPRGVRHPLHASVGAGHRISIHAPTWGATVKPSNGWLLGHKDNEFANENIIIINSVNIT